MNYIEKEKFNELLNILYEYIELSEKLEIKIKILKYKFLIRDMLEECTNMILNESVIGLDEERFNYLINKIHDMINLSEQN